VNGYRDLGAMLRLDLAEVMGSRWLFVCLGLYGLFGAGFVLIGMRESSVIDFTGIGRVLFSLCHALVLLLPLVALMLTGQVVNRARDEGALELYLTHPVRRASYFAAVSLVRYAALVVPLVGVLVLLSLVGRLAFGQQIPWAFVARSLAVSCALIWAFAALGLATSVSVRSPVRATTYLVLFWVTGVALLDFGVIGVMLTWRLEPRAVFLLAALNPIETARLALLSAAEPDLATFGPVGFYLATQLGPTRLLALGIGWPLVFGCTAWLLALRSFRRQDAI
jgi:ABC-type transport system involved in multi-copper enzyme maturation permease subunit